MTAFRPGQPPRGSATYGMRRGPDALMVTAVAVLILGVGTGIILALQSLADPDDPVTETSFAPAQTSSAPAPTAAPSPTAAASPSVASPSAPSPSEPPAQLFSAVRGLGSQLCLDVAPDEPGAGGRLIIAPCSGAPSQVWRLTATGALVNGATALCLAVAGGTFDDGGRVQQEPCGEATSQRWRLAPAGDGAATLAALHSGRCLDVAAGATAAGTPVQQYTCNSTPAQRWVLQPG